MEAADPKPRHGTPGFRLAIELDSSADTIPSLGGLHECHSHHKPPDRW